MVILRTAPGRIDRYSRRPKRRIASTIPAGAEADGELRRRATGLCVRSLDRYPKQLR